MEPYVADVTDVSNVSNKPSGTTTSRLLGVLQACGQEVDIYDLPDRTSSLEAAVLLPRSVTSNWLLAEPDLAVVSRADLG